MAVLFCACADATPATQAAVRTDSAGVVILTNDRWVASEFGLWKLDDLAISIGGADTDQAGALLTFVRTAFLRSDGSIVLTDNGTNEVRFFSPTGRHVRSVGREGDGPGGFRGLGAVFPYRGDSLVAWDYRRSRVTVLARDGTFGRSVVVGPPAEVNASVFLVGAAAGGRLYSRAEQVSFPGVQGPYRTSVAVLRYSAAGLFEKAIASVPGRERFQATVEAGAVFPQLILGHDAYVSVAPDRVWLGSSDRYEIASYDTTGLDMLIWMRLESRRPTSEDAARAREQFVAENSLHLPAEQIRHLAG